MHEVSIAWNIFKIVEEELIKNDSIGKLKIVKLKVGRLTAVVPAALDFAWGAIIKGTGLDGSKLEMEEIPILLKCNSCNKEFTIDEPVFICTECDSTSTEILTGNELDIISLIIND